MNTEEIRSLNPNITNTRINRPYPHIELLEPSDAVALVITSLPKGDIPVLCDYQGSVRKIASIAKSALVFFNLMKVSPLRYHFDNENAVNLKTSLDIMEVLS